MIARLGELSLGESDERPTAYLKGSGIGGNSGSKDISEPFRSPLSHTQQRRKGDFQKANPFRRLDGASPLSDVGEDRLHVFVILELVDEDLDLVELLVGVFHRRAR